MRREVHPSTYKDKKDIMDDWKQAAQDEAEKVRNEALANGSSHSKATRLARRHYGRLRGQAAAREEVTAIKEAGLWPARMKAAKDVAAERNEASDAETAKQLPSQRDILNRIAGL